MMVLSAKIKLHNSRKVDSASKMWFSFCYLKVRDETRKLNSERKSGKREKRFKPFLLMNDEFCIQYKKINNIFRR